MHQFSKKEPLELQLGKISQSSKVEVAEDKHRENLRIFQQSGDDENERENLAS